MQNYTTGYGICMQGKLVMLLYGDTGFHAQYTLRDKPVDFEVKNPLKHYQMSLSQQGI